MRGLAMSGGGFFGNFHLGVLHVLAERQAAGIEAPYDHVAGVSAGALVAGQICAYPRELLRVGVQVARSTWTPLRTSKVHRRHRPFGMLHGLWRGSLRDSRPLQRLVDDVIDVTALRHSEYGWQVGAVNLETGLYELFDQDFPDDLAKAFLASSSFPLMLAPVRVRGRGLYTDGGLHSVTPLGALIRAGCADIDVLIASPRVLPRLKDQTPEVPEIAARAIEIMVNALTWKDVKLAQAYNGWAKVPEGGCPKRYVKLRIFAPPGEMPGRSLDFDPEIAVQVQAIGRNVATLVP